MQTAATSWGTEMLRTAVGFNPQTSLLRGLRGTSAYGQAMQAGSELGMEQAKNNAQLHMQGLEQQSQQRQKTASNNAQKQSAALQRKGQNAQIEHKKQMSDLNTRMGYKQLNKRKDISKKQTVLNQLAQE